MSFQDVLKAVKQPKTYAVYEHRWQALRALHWMSKATWREFFIEQMDDGRWRLCGY